MKGKIKITELDYVRLCNLINSFRDTKTIELKNIEALDAEIKRAKKVQSKKITAEFVTMNSKMEITDLDTSKQMAIRLVYPRDADFRNGNVSVFSPLGSALLGYKEGDTIVFEVPAGMKRIRIDKILYQPEANGEYTV